MARAYGSIDPEMSHSTTSRRGRRDGAREDEPVPHPRRSAGPAASVDRMSMRGPPGLRCWRRDRRSGTARLSSRISPASSNQLGVGQLGEVLLGQPLHGAAQVAGSRSPARPGPRRPRPRPGCPAGRVSLTWARATWAARASRSSGWPTPLAGAGHVRAARPGRPGRPVRRRPGRTRPAGSRSGPGRIRVSRARTGRARQVAAGRKMVIALANRSQRSGPTPRPASRSAAPNRATTSARSSAGPGAGLVSAIARHQRAEPFGPGHLQVLGVLEHGARGPLGRVLVELRRARACAGPRSS